MARTFSSINEVSNYITSQCFNEMLEEIGKKTEETMKQVTEDQVQGDTGDMINCIGITEQTNNSVTVAWQDDKGSWFSLASNTHGQHMYAPWALEEGKTFEIGKPMFQGFYHPKTTLKQTSEEIMRKELVDIARKILAKRGFGV